MSDHATQTKQMRDMAAMKMPYAYQSPVTRAAGSSISQKRIGLTILALLLSVAPAFAQGTVMPIPKMTWLDANGEPLAFGRLCVFAAGTSTLATTYTTAAMTVENTNPVVLDGSGRSTVFLAPGNSYKFVLKDDTTTTCVPDTGVTLWTVDNVSAVPASSVNIDVAGTVGEDVTAGNILYLSDGSGSKNAGQWYKADADLSYAGVLPELGAAVNDIASGESGSIRLTGRVTGLAGLTPGGSYYVSTTPGSMVATAPLMARQVGQADSASSLILAPNPRTTRIMPRAPCGRLTLTTNVPVTTADVTAATTLYYTPYGCSTASLYNGTSSWYQTDFAQVSIAVPATTSTLYDVYLYDNAGTPTLELTAWTNDTTRATALATQNGVYVKTGALTRLYVGSFRTTGVSGQTEDSVTKRYVWNYYNRVPREMKVTDATVSWSYSTATWRQARAQTANQLDVVIGVAEQPLQLHLVAYSAADTAGLFATSGIGEDSTTTPIATATGQHFTDTGTVNIPQAVPVNLTKVPTAGRHFYAWLEAATAGGTTTWYGTPGATTAATNQSQSLFYGVVWG